MNDGIRIDRWVAAVALVALVALLFARAASAQNLAANPEFDVDVDGWAEIPDPSMTVDWSELDRNGDQNSGSLRGLNSDTNAANLGIVSCVDSISEGTTYQYSGFVHIPTGQTGIGSVEIGFNWFDGIGCTGNEELGGFSNAVGSADAWFYVTVEPAIVPSGAQSAQLRINVNKFVGGTLAAHADGIDFRATLFRDGFESSSPINWSTWMGFED